MFDELALTASTTFEGFRLHSTRLTRHGQARQVAAWQGKARPGVAGMLPAALKTPETTLVSGVSFPCSWRSAAKRRKENDSNAERNGPARIP
jgi:hypothetical protein